MKKYYVNRQGQLPLREEVKPEDRLRLGGTSFSVRAPFLWAVVALFVVAAIVSFIEK